MGDRKPPLHYTIAVYKVLRKSREPLSCIAIFRNVITRFPHLMNSGSLVGDILRFLRTSLFIAIGDPSNSATVMVYILNPEHDKMTIDRATGRLNGIAQVSGEFTDLLDLRQ
ncbi:hypothetical protein PRIPAC_96031 [Pristionchus pacificus]|uniref:Uncharacterized protein n=1 Tax=Pristionchus pacificus TaxID=54126 RepID=A0A2A6BCQ7_PRIPA|nr:hypothetical protein PRIPAC_96031 [Pristionchus pacificus]|eukprot:PDM63636.1 hypothetical protein PRIPAC_49609 [Pristionchus pacificus]